MLRQGRSGEVGYVLVVARRVKAGVASCVSVGYDCGQVESIRGMVLRGVLWRGRRGNFSCVLDRYVTAGGARSG